MTLKGKIAANVPIIGNNLETVRDRIIVIIIIYIIN